MIRLATQINNDDGADGEMIGIIHFLLLTHMLERLEVVQTLLATLGCSSNRRIIHFK